MLDGHLHSVTSAFVSTPSRGIMAKPTPLAAHFANVPSRLLKGDVPLFADGDAKSTAYLIESGCVLLYKIVAQGTRQIIGFAFAGDYLALDGEGEHDASAQCIGATRVRATSALQLTRRAAMDPALAKEILEHLSHELSAARRHAITIGRLSATGRVATFLLELSARNAKKKLDPTSLLLAMRRNDIADYLCLSVETVSRTLTELKQLELIRLRGWRLVKLLDFKSLERLALGDGRHNSSHSLREAA